MIQKQSALERAFGEDGWPTFIGCIAGFVVFFVAYLAAVGSAGWVIGGALGWIPAGIASMVTYFVCRYLWPVVLVVIVLVALHTMG